MVKKKEARDAHIENDNEENETMENESGSEIEYVYSESDGDEGDGEDSDTENLNENEIIEEENLKLLSELEPQCENDDSEESQAENDDRSQNDDDKSKDENKNKKGAKKKKISEPQDAESDDENIAGFADAISKILGKTKVPGGKKHVILAKGKTDKEIRKHKLDKLPESESGTKERILDWEELKEQRKKRKILLELGKIKPTVLERNKEKQLKAIATKGIVQLFNAVHQQQKMMNENMSGVSSSERKKEKVIESMTKKSFISLLQNTKVDLSTDPIVENAKEEPERKIWNVLKDDFMLGGAKMKDWDKQENSDVV